MSRFVRYRYNSSASHGKWKFKEYPEHWTDEDVKEDLRDGSGFDDSPHYRGCEIERIELPPVEWLGREVKTAKRMIKVYSSVIERYEKIIEKINK